MRLKTKTFLTSGQSATAASVISFSLMVLEPRLPTSAVQTHWDAESWMRSRSEPAVKPAKTTECGAPTCGAAERSRRRRGGVAATRAREAVALPASPRAARVNSDRGGSL